MYLSFEEEFHLIYSHQFAEENESDYIPLGKLRSLMTHIRQEKEGLEMFRLEHRRVDPRYQAHHELKDLMTDAEKAQAEAQKDLARYEV